MRGVRELDQRDVLHANEAVQRSSRSTQQAPVPTKEEQADLSDDMSSLDRIFGLRVEETVMQGYGKVGEGSDGDDVSLRVEEGV